MTVLKMVGESCFAKNVIKRFFTLKAQHVKTVETRQIISNVVTADYLTNLKEVTKQWKDFAKK